MVYYLCRFQARIGPWTPKQDGKDCWEETPKTHELRAKKKKKNSILLFFKPFLVYQAIFRFSTTLKAKVLIVWFMIESH